MDSRLFVLATVGLALVVPSAASADVTTNCANLQANLDSSTTGEVITLNETCLNKSFSLPNRTITLQAAAAGDGFDGTDSGPILHGAQVGNTTIQGLTFTNGNASTDGAAISIFAITGNATPQILNNVFEDNHSTATGGAVAVQPAGTAGTTTISGNTFGVVGHGNSAQQQGGGAIWLNLSSFPAALSNNSFVGNSVGGPGDGGGGGALVDTSLSTATVSISDNTFDANTVSKTSTGRANGGALLVHPSGSSGVAITGNQFLESSIDASGAGDRFGGGVAINNQANNAASVTQSGNVFDENSIGATGTGTELGGAGEWIAGVTVYSSGDTFTSNHVLDGGGEGGGIGVEGIQISAGVFNAGELHASDLVSDGNALVAGGIGAGVYAGSEDTCTTTDCPSVLELNDSTVAGNCIDAGTGSDAPGIAGSGDDKLTLRNSIVYDTQATLPCASPAAAAEVSGFTAPNTAVTFTDLCAGGAPFTGAGNICADPLLVNPHFGDYHETAASPTVDKGSNGLVPSGLTTDLEGQPRIIGSAVDMGADEFQPPLVAPPVSPPGAGKDTLAPVFSILKQTLIADSRGRVKFKLRCTENTRCIGTISLQTARPVIAKKRKARRLKLASKRFNVAGGKTSTVTLKLSRKARKLLARKHSLKVTATVTGKDTIGNAAKSVKRTLTLKQKRPKHRRRA